MPQLVFHYLPDAVAEFDHPAFLFSAQSLTPCEEIDGAWFKRDDLFVPFVDVPISGGKVRQCMALLATNADYIRRQCGGVILTATGVHSPQGLIVARVANLFGFRCVVFVGATKDAMSHKMIRTAAGLTGVEVDAGCRIGYETALTSRIRQWQHDHRGHGFHVKFGINLEEDPAAIIGTTADQCRNIPGEVDTICISVGSGITAAGILLGVRKHCPHVRRVVCVQIAGYDRRDAIRAIAGDLPFEWHSTKRWPYSTHVRRSVGGVDLDPIYEAKAFAVCAEELGLGTGAANVCHWLVGSSIAVR